MKRTATTLIELSACEMAEGIRSREFSSLELIDAHLAQIDRLNPVLNAYVQLRAEEARDEAKRADALGLHRNFTWAAARCSHQH